MLVNNCKFLNIESKHCALWSATSIHATVKDCKPHQMNNLLNKRGLPKQTELRILNYKETSMFHRPFYQLCCQKVQLVGLGDFQATNETEAWQPVGVLIGSQRLWCRGSPRCLRFSGIDLALEADPHGGAKKIPMTFSLDSHCISKLTPASVVRSATATGAKCIDHSKSLQLSRNP